MQRSNRCHLIIEQTCRIKNFTFFILHFEFKELG